MGQSAAKQIEALRKQLRHHDRKYYIDAAPEISDTQYDQLMRQLQQLESEHPELITADSPTQRVGEDPVPHLVQVEHKVTMLSIENAYSIEELQDFGKRAQELLDAPSVEWIVELKIDGVACALIYEKGQLVRALTRGNGKVGDDITHNMRTLADVPLMLDGDNIPDILEVRGEVYMTNQQLVKLNQLQQSRGDEPFKNTRNATAGAIRVLDPKICAERGLRFFAHSIGHCEGLRSDNHMSFLDEVRGYGIPATPMVQSFKTFDQAVKHAEELSEQLHELDFEVDGIVLKVNRFSQREELGARSKSPRWVVAYKWEKYEAITKLNSISVQIGKTGAITPVAELEPVELAGTIVSRASLHNAEEIARKDVRVGDMVVVEKAGKIIPHIVRVELQDRPNGLPEFQFPTACPECETTLVKDEGGVYIRCPNPACPAQIKERLRYFASRNAMDIEGLGEKLVDQLVTSGMVKTFGDLYRLTEDKIIELERMGKRSAAALIKGLADSKQRGLARLLNALSIRHVGEGGSSRLAAHFGNLSALRRATEEEIAAVADVGQITAKCVVEFLTSDYGRETLDDLVEQGLNTEAPKTELAGTSLAGKTFVVTGTLQNHTRNEIHDLIKQNGGKVSSSVSKNTSYLVAGEEAGSKLAKAEKLNVPVLSEDDFIELLNSSAEEQE